MPDYNEGKIYKIVKKDDESQCYVGSTTRTLEERLRFHKNYEKTLELSFYKFINGKWDEWKMELIENFPCGCVEICNKIECNRKLRKREGEFIREIGTLNKKTAGQTGKEYADLHREEIREKWKKYHEEKKDEINAKRRQKWSENKDECCKKLQEWRALKKANQSEEEKLEEKKRIAEQRKKHRDENKDEINRKKRERYALKQAEKKLEKLNLGN